VLRAIASGVLHLCFYNQRSAFYRPLTLSDTSTDHTAAALGLIAQDMAALDRVIAERLSSDVPLVSQIAQYIITSGGKRLRPALLLLVSGALGHQDPRRHLLAAVVEFIHTATLLHDDVVDESTMRRGRATANESFGNAASVLVGDFVYSRAFQMMVDVGDMRIMSTLADTTNVIAEGEVLQLMNMHDASLSEADYLRVIRSKTAQLFEASARLAAMLNPSSAALESACATYGQALGTAFQIIDDVLDYAGNAKDLGKNLGDDLREGKLTLPVICTLQRVNPDEAALITKAIEDGDVSELPRIVAMIQNSGGLQDAREAAHQEALRAIAALEAFPANAHTDALRGLAQSLLARRN